MVPKMKIWVVHNWGKFQHYKQEQGKPPWIKLYRDLLRDHAFMQLPESERWVVIGLWIIAAETGNQIPDDPTYLKATLNLRRRPNLEKFERLGFIESRESLE